MKVTYIQDETYGKEGAVLTVPFPVSDLEMINRLATEIADAGWIAQSEALYRVYSHLRHPTSYEVEVN